MYELYEIARNNKWDKTLFTTHILVVWVEFIRFDKPAVLEPYLEYWETQEEEWKALIKKRRITEAQSRRYHVTQDINNNFGKLADWLVDINASTIKLLSENDFEIVKKTILDRLTPSKPDHEA